MPRRSQGSNPHRTRSLWGLGNQSVDEADTGGPGPIRRTVTRSLQPDMLRNARPATEGLVQIRDLTVHFRAMAEVRPDRAVGRGRPAARGVETWVLRQIAGLYRALDERFTGGAVAPRTALGAAAAAPSLCTDGGRARTGFQPLWTATLGGPLPALGGICRQFGHQLRRLSFAVGVPEAFPCVQNGIFVLSLGGDYRSLRSPKTGWFPMINILRAAGYVQEPLSCGWRGSSGGGSATATRAAVSISGAASESKLGECATLCVEIVEERAPFASMLVCATASKEEHE